MIQYERIDVSEEIDLNKTGTSKGCMRCHYWYFLDTGYEYEHCVCNGCHDLPMMVHDLEDFMILNVKGVDYRCFVQNMRKSTTNKLLNNSKLDNKDIL